jgi:hypothetical protein
VGYRKVPLITNLTEKKIGKVIKVEKDISGVCNFVRVRVKIDVRNEGFRSIVNQKISYECEQESQDLI